MSFPNLILQLSIWSILLPLVAGFLFFNQLDKSSRLVFYIVLLAAIPQFLTVSMIHTKNLNIVYNVYTLIEFLLFYFFIGQSFQKLLFKKISITLLVLFYGIAIWLVMQYGLYVKFLNELVCAANITYLIWIFMFILEGVLNDQNLMNPRLPVFWFIVGLLLYAPCTIFTFALTYYIERSTIPLIHHLCSIQGVFNTIMYILFAIGLYKNHTLLQRRSKLA